MSRSTQGFPWRFAVYLIAVCYLLSDLVVFKGPLYKLLMEQAPRGETAAEVYGRSITRLELQEAMREHLWKHNETWAGLSPETRKQTRWLTLENLVNDRLLHASRMMSSPATEVPKAPVKREAERMQRQFSDAAEFLRRLAAQQLTPQSLDARIHEAQLDEEWVTAQIQPRLKATSEQDVRAWYDEHMDTLHIPPSYHAAHIFLTRHDKSKPDREAEIREIQRQLLAREKTFAQLAKETSDDARSKVLGGDLGWFTQARMPADFIVAVQNLKIGQLSGPVQTQLGWHLIIVLEHRASRLPTFQETKAEIAALLISQQREQALQSLLSELRDRSGQSVVYHAEIIDRADPAP